MTNGAEAIFSLPIKKGSDSLNVVQRELSEDFSRSKLENQICGAYRKAPYFPEIFPVVKEIIHFEENNLFDYIFNSVQEICKYLGISTELKTSSKINIDHSLRAQDKVLAICKSRQFEIYINAIGGADLYSTDDFKSNGIDLKFIQSNIQPYPQGAHDFVSHLSIIDVLMHCDKASVLRQLSNYSLV